MSDYELESITNEVMGIDADTIKLLTGAGGEIVKAAGEAGANKVAKDAADAKAKASAADLEAARQARADAKVADLKAQSEKDPAGPLHIDALRKDAAAQQLEAKVGLAPGLGASIPPQKGVSGRSGSFFTKMAGPLPIYGWGLVGLGGLGVVVGLAKLLGGKKRR